MLEIPVATTIGLRPIRSNLYGVEIELEAEQPKSGQKRPSIRWSAAPGLKDYWHVENDDSLRNGVEFVSGKLSQRQIKETLPKLQKIVDGFKLKATRRCGTHVHVNVLNLVWGQFYSFVAYFALFEPELFEIFAKDRNDNHFCVPLYWNTYLQDLFAKGNEIARTVEINPPPPKSKSSNATRSQFITIEENGRTVRVRRPQSNFLAQVAAVVTSKNRHSQVPFAGTQKYSSLTAFRLLDLGTLEFRLMAATQDVTKVSDFVAVLGRLKHMAYKCMDPLAVQEEYERVGRERIWSKLKLGRRPTIPQDIIEEAEEAAFKIIGEKPVSKDKFDWTMRK